MAQDTTLPNIEKSLESNMLWPPIADALSAFIRRRSAGADGYELTWRLIHVWEATAAVLTGAATSRVRTLGEKSRGDFLKCREHFHGRNMDPLSKTFKNSQGILAGSAGKRIEVLVASEGFDAARSKFLQSCDRFLKSVGVNLQPLMISWQQICDAPAEAAISEKVSVRDAFRHLNSFRNRFAHVPFPYDEMPKIAGTFALLTEELFSVEPKPWQSFPDDRVESALSGAITYRFRRLRGSATPERCDSGSNEPDFVFPANAAKPIEAVERWEAAPFIFVDSMFRPSVLTRLISEANGVWEYTRFLAERNSVIREEKHHYIEKLPAPSSADYPIPADEQAEETAVAAAIQPVPQKKDQKTPDENRNVGFERALRHIANEEYEPAIQFFQELVDKQPAYHIGWLRLGHALRELGMRLRFSDPKRASELFERSLGALTRAVAHIDSSWQAQALYERSKSHYQRWRLDHDAGKDDTQRAFADAEAAFLRTRDLKYQTWLEYLIQHGVPLAPNKTEEPA